MNIIKIIINFILSLLKSNKNEGAPALPPLVELTPDTPVSQEQPAQEIKPLNAKLTGAEFGKSILNVGPNQQREDLIYKQFVNSGMPNFMQNFKTITIVDGTNKLQYKVSLDFICIGVDEDYLRTPLNPLTARKVADHFKCVLPTRKMSNQIWKAADVKMQPIPNGPPYDATMQSTATMISHNNKIQKVLGNFVGNLIAGHKKDVVFSKAILTYKNNVAIYGWHYPNGTPIQGLNPKDHDNKYKDYSHGIRLIGRKMILNGNEVDFFDILKDPSLSTLISDEGPFDATKMYIG